MLINIFKPQENQINDINEENESNKIDKQTIYNDIQEYLISNYLNLLQNEEKELIEEKIIEQLTNKYLIIDEQEKKKYLEIIIDKLFGYDILQKYIDDQTISDIRVVKWNKIYIKRKGIWEIVEDSFKDKENFETYIRYVILKNGGKINFEYPITSISDKKYNLRIEAGISPVNVIEPSLVIRIHRYSKKLNLETLFLEHEMMDINIYKFLKFAVSKKLNIVIAGKGASGKTSLLRALVSDMDDNIAIATNEETCELYIEDKNIIQREIVSNRENNKNVDLEKLMLHSLVMSNDAIIIGEIKGKESLLFFDAISTRTYRIYNCSF